MSRAFGVAALNGAAQRGRLIVPKTVINCQQPKHLYRPPYPLDKLSRIAALEENSGNLPRKSLELLCNRQAAAKIAATDAEIVGQALRLPKLRSASDALALQRQDRESRRGA
jgi:hypothetical protein